METTAERWASRVRGLKPLAALLRVRRIEEDRARDGLLRARKAIDEETAAIRRLEAEREEAKEKLRALASGIVDRDEILRYRGYINFLFRAVATRRAHVEELRPALAAAQSAYREASARRETVETLIARKTEDAAAEERRRETRELDEVGIRNAARREVRSC